jgi:hypothetical protein
MAGSIQMMALKLVVLQLTIAGWLYNVHIPDVSIPQVTQP